MTGKSRLHRPLPLPDRAGSDFAALFVVFPSALIAAVLAFRGHVAGPILGSGIGVFAVYTYAHVVLSLATVRAELPPPSPPVRKTAAFSLLAVAVMYPLLTGYAFLAASVASMAVVMFAKADPDASLALMVAFLAFALVFAGLAVMIYRPLFTGRRDQRGGPVLGSGRK